MNLSEFEKELKELINKHSIDNDCNTPDFVLAEYLSGMLRAYYITKTKADKLNLGGKITWAGEPILCEAGDVIHVKNGSYLLYKK